jgi:hypothetical protein
LAIPSLVASGVLPIARKLYGNIAPWIPHRDDDPPAWRVARASPLRGDEPGTA